MTGFAVGDRVGVGCMVNSCRECENCQAGNEQYCIPGNTQTYGSVDRDGTVTYGGYSDHVVVDQDFVAADPGRARARRGRAAAVRRHHHLLAAAPLERRARASRSRSSASAASATWR